MTCVVNLKLAFAEWFFYNLVILIKLFKIRYLNLDKAILFSKNPVICVKNWKLWRAPTSTKFNNFCWNFAHVFYLTISTNWCSWFFCILFRSWVINKNVKNECVETRFFWFLQITQDLNKIKKNPEHPFIDICAKFQQKIFNSMIVGARQHFQFFRKKKQLSQKQWSFV